MKGQKEKCVFDLEAGSTIYVDARVRRGGPDEYRPIDQIVGLESVTPTRTKNTNVDRLKLCAFQHLDMTDMTERSARTANDLLEQDGTRYVLSKRWRSLLQLWPKLWPPLFQITAPDDVSPLP